MTNQQLKAHCGRPTLNEKQVELATKDCLREIQSLQDSLAKTDAYRVVTESRLHRQQIALIALTAKPIDFEEDEAAFEKGVSALIDCLEDCGDAEQGLRMALRAMTGVKS